LIEQDLYTSLACYLQGGEVMQIQRYQISFFENKFINESNSDVKQRLQLLLYLREDRNMRNVAEILRVSLGSVSYWKQRFEKEGLAGLQDKIGRGRKSELNKKQLKYLMSAIDSGIKMKDGYKRGFKTKDIREFIQNRFGISYTPRHCRRVMRKMKYNLKVPRSRNKSRSQKSVDEFKEQFKKNFQVWTKKQ
jgi:transposase